MSIATLVLAVSALAYPVDPFIGTQGGGHVFPGAVYPFGMVQLSPDTQTRYWKESHPWAPGRQLYFAMRFSSKPTGNGIYKREPKPEYSLPAPRGPGVMMSFPRGPRTGGRV